MSETSPSANLTSRERLCVILLLLALRIVSPFKYSSEMEAEVKKIREAL